MSTANRLFRVFWLFLSFVALAGCPQSDQTGKQEKAKNSQKTLEQEIFRHSNPKELIQALTEIFNESNPTQQIKLISPWLQPDTKKSLTREKYPYTWAMLHEMAGDAFANLYDKHRAENLEQAITHYQQALQVFTRKAFPEDWAKTQKNLGAAYWQRIRDRPTDNLEQAIEHSRQALQVYTHEAFPQDWAMTQLTLAHAYADRIRGERADNLEQAIAHFQQAQKVLTREASPEQWAMTQYKLAMVYRKRIRGDPADNLEQAIHHYQQASQVYTREAFPREWEIIQDNLTSANADFNRIRNERADPQAIFAAVKSGDYIAVKRFLTQGTSPNVTDENGLPILILAAASGQVEVVKVLLDSGANVDATNQYKQTALRYAASKGHLDIAKLLIEKGANVNEADSLNKTTPLIAASMGGHVDLVKFVIMKGANVNAQETDGGTALHYAAFIGNLAVVKVLLEANAFVDPRWSGRTPLITAASQGYDNTVLLLLKHGADVNATDDLDLSALDVSIQEHRTFLVDTLLKNGADPNRRNTLGWPMLLQAIQAGDLSVVDALLNAGADPNARTLTSGLSALELAESENRKDIVALLTSHIRSMHANTTLEAEIEATYRSLFQELFQKSPPLEAMMQEIFRHDSSQELLQAVDKIFNESNPSEKIKLIYPWLLPNTQKTLSKKKYPFLWAMLHKEMGDALQDLRDTRRAESQEDAIVHYQKALQIYTRKDFPEPWAEIQHNLGVTYSQRILGKRAENLEQAIEHYQQVLQIYTREALPEQWAMTQDNLANAYNQRIRGDRAVNLEKAIEHHQQALQVYTHEALPEQWAITQNNLANTYRDRIRGTRTDNLKQAIMHCQQALLVLTHEAFPEEFIQTTYNLSRTLLETRQYRAALTHLIAILEVNEERLQQISLPPEERLYLVEQAQVLFANTIWAAAQSGDAAQVVRLLEWSKTRLLRENLTLATINLRGISAKMQAKLREIAGEVSNVESLLQLLEQSKNRLQRRTLALDTVNLRDIPAETQTEVRELQAQKSSLEIQLQHQINQIDQHQLRTYLQDKRKQLREALQAAGITATQAPTDKALRQWLAALPPDSTLIAPVFSDFGTVVLVLPAGAKAIGKADMLVLPEFSRKDLRAVTRGEKEDEWGGYLKAYWEWTGEADKAARTEKQKAWQGALNNSLDALRGGLLEPVLKRLQELEIKPGADLFWLPDSDSSLLPVHAVMLGDKPLLAQYTVHFIPSLYSAYTAQQRMAGKPGERLLALVNPTENLTFTPIEGELVSRFFDLPVVLQGKEGDREHLMQAFEKKPAYLHLSTHGKYDWQTPLESGLELANQEHLTLGDLLSKPDFLAGSRLAVLSACETGITDIKAPAEALGLPAAFLQAGVPGVVSTLWTVNDLSTTFLLGKFYELHRGEGVEPAQALARAQEWLRTANYKVLRDWLSRQATLLHDSPKLGEIAVLLNNLRLQADKTPDAKPYQEPYYWAGFVYSGV